MLLKRDAKNQNRYGKKTLTPARLSPLWIRGYDAPEVNELMTLDAIRWRPPINHNCLSIQFFLPVVALRAAHLYMEPFQRVRRGVVVERPGAPFGHRVAVLAVLFTI